MELKWNMSVLWIGGHKLSYEKYFYRTRTYGKFTGSTVGFPMQRGPWCNKLKTELVWQKSKSNLREGILPCSNKENEFQNVTRDNNGISIFNSSLVQQHVEEKSFKFFISSIAQGADKNIVQYLGIASDEPERIERHKKSGFKLPLVEIGWDEAYCRKWCEENDLLSPIYTDSTRGGCWFCHNQGIDQLRKLRKNYPDLWSLLLKWDIDSPVTFRADGTTIHDFDIRFRMEKFNLVPMDRKFRWNMLKDEDRLNKLKTYEEEKYGSVREN